MLSPVLSPAEAAYHPNARARGIFKGHIPSQCPHPGFPGQKHRCRAHRLRLAQTAVTFWSVRALQQKKSAICSTPASYPEPPTRKEFP